MTLRTHDITVLVVDDPYVRSFVRTLLERHGYKVIATDLASGLELVSTGGTQIDVLITNQPAAFAGHSRDLPLVYIAAFPEESLALPFHRRRLLSKPFAPQQLLQALDDLVNDGALVH